MIIKDAKHQASSVYQANSIQSMHSMIITHIDTPMRVIQTLSNRLLDLGFSRHT